MKRGAAALLFALLVFAPLLSVRAAEEGEHAAGGVPTELIFKWLNFITVFGGLGYLLRKPMREFFTGQREAIQSSIEEARRAREESRARLRGVEERLARLAVSLAEQEIRQRLTPQAHAALFQAFAGHLAPGKERRA